MSKMKCFKSWLEEEKITIQQYDNFNMIYKQLLILDFMFERKKMEIGCK